VWPQLVGSVPASRGTPVIRANGLAIMKMPALLSAQLQRLTDFLWQAFRVLLIVLVIQLIAANSMAIERAVRYLVKWCSAARLVDAAGTALVVGGTDSAAGPIRVALPIALRRRNASSGVDPIPLRVVGP
jgi:hypothetical protein